jgi:RHS repeat-associated protein
MAFSMWGGRATWDRAGKFNSSAAINWLISDHLGTPRMVFDQSGTLANVKRHDYLPFGEELFAGTGGRTVAQGYVADGVRQQFTSKERDVETGLDYFGTRYFASTQGRFTSADPLFASGRTWAPQSWNRYSYVLNNPLRLIDPTGLADEDPQDPKKQNEQPKPVAVDQISVGGVTVKVEQMNEPAGFQKVINGTERVGVGVQLNFTVTDVNGKPLEGATAIENVRALEGPAVIQNQDTVVLDSQGRGSDFVTNSAPTPKTREEAQALIQQLKDPNNSTKQEFNLTITLKSGTQVEVTQVRTLTNKTADGKLQPEDRGLGFGPGVPGYTFRMEKMKGRVIKP